MTQTKIWPVLLGVLALAAVPAACGDGDDDRVTLEEDELERELDLALQEDGASPTFEDTAVAAAPTADAQAPRPAPIPSPEPARARPRTQPEPRPQAATPPEPVRRVTRTAPAGSSFAVTLNQELSTLTNQPGDPFTATLVEPILSADGQVVVPAGATVRGRVTAVEKSDRVGDMAVIKVAFESVAFGGQSYALDASVLQADPERRTRTPAKEQAAKVAAGAAAGAILGKVIGKDNSDALKGAAIGAAAGTAIAMGTADVDAVLPQGSRMVVRLDAPIVVS